MGLDIYFEKRKKSVDIETFNKVGKEIDDIYHLPTEEFNKILTQNRLTKLEEKYNELDPRSEIAYFRKVNFLVAFFKYDENCTYQEISKDDVEELISRCNRILETKKEIDNEIVINNELADELLPTQRGFFFGHYEYDSWYIMDVEGVLNTFTTILNETNWDKEIVEMYCSW